MGENRPDGLFKGGAEHGEAVSRRRAIAAAGGVAAALGVGAIAFLGARSGALDRGEMALASLAVRLEEPGGGADQGVASSTPADDAEAVAGAGYAPNNVADVDPASAFQADESLSRAAKEGGEPKQLEAVWDFDGLEPGKAYLFTATALKALWEPVDDPGSYPEGWEFPKVLDGAPMRIASTVPAACASSIVVPSAPSGTARRPLALPAGMDAGDAIARSSMRMISVC